MKLVLYVKDITPDSCFHYGRKQGGDLTFVYNQKKDRHEAKFTLEEWRENDFYIARQLLDQSLCVPVFFDIDEDAEPVTPQVTAVTIPVTAPEPPAAPVKPARKSRLTDEQRQAAKAAYESQQAEPTPSFIPK